MACGYSRTNPRTREGNGAVTSSIRTVNAPLSHDIALGPMCSEFALRKT